MKWGLVSRKVETHGTTFNETMSCYSAETPT
jgi:hypothetical protein